MASLRISAARQKEPQLRSVNWLRGDDPSVFTQRHRHFFHDTTVEGDPELTNLRSVADKFDFLEATVNDSADGLSSSEAGESTDPSLAMTTFESRIRSSNTHSKDYSDDVRIPNR